MGPEDKGPREGNGAPLSADQPHPQQRALMGQCRAFPTQRTQIDFVVDFFPAPFYLGLGCFIFFHKISHVVHSLIFHLATYCEHFPCH